MNNIEVFRNELAGQADKFAAVLGGAAETARFQQIVISAIAASQAAGQDLLAPDVDRGSLLLACLYAAESGLSPDPNRGHCYFIPRRNKRTGKKHVQFQTGYKGLLDLAYRSGKVSAVETGIVYEKDIFNFQRGTDSYLHHKPGVPGKTLGAPTHAWAMAQIPGCRPVFEVVTLEEIEQARKRGGDRAFSPWDSDFAAMARKVPFRRLAKWLPQCDLLQRVVHIEERQEAEFERDNAPRTTLEALRERLAPGAVGGMDVSPGPPGPGGTKGTPAPGAALPEPDAATVELRAKVRREAAAAPPLPEGGLFFNEDAIPDEEAGIKAIKGR